MAVVSIPEKKMTLTEDSRIAEYLNGIGIEYERWTVIDPEDAAGDEAILHAYAEKIGEVQARGGYTSVDVINIHPQTDGLKEMLARFNREHWHDEDEVRFTVHGRGLFHIHPPAGPVVAIEVGPGDMIRVPRGTHHWFDLCADQEITTIRFFQNRTGWTPHYTNTGAEQRCEPVCFGPAYFPHRGL